MYQTRYYSACIIFANTIYQTTPKGEKKPLLSIVPLHCSSLLLFESHQRFTSDRYFVHKAIAGDFNLFYLLVSLHLDVAHCRWISRVVSSSVSMKPPHWLLFSLKSYGTIVSGVSLTLLSTLSLSLYLLASNLWLASTDLGLDWSSSKPMFRAWHALLPLLWENLIESACHSLQRLWPYVWLPSVAIRPSIIENCQFSRSGFWNLPTAYLLRRSLWCRCSIRHSYASTFRL